MGSYENHLVLNSKIRCGSLALNHLPDDQGRAKAAETLVYQTQHT